MSSATPRFESPGGHLLLVEDAHLRVRATALHRARSASYGCRLSDSVQEISRWDRPSRWARWRRAQDQCLLGNRDRDVLRRPSATAFPRIVCWRGGPDRDRHRGDRSTLARFQLARSGWCENGWTFADLRCGPTGSLPHSFSRLRRSSLYRDSDRDDQRHPCRTTGGPLAAPELL